MTRARTIAPRRIRECSERPVEVLILNHMVHYGAARVRTQVPHPANVGWLGGAAPREPDALDALGQGVEGVWVTVDQDHAFVSWSKALALPTVMGLVIGRSLLYPPGDDVAAAVDAAVELL